MPCILTGFGVTVIRSPEVNRSAVQAICRFQIRPAPAFASCALQTNCEWALAVEWAVNACEIALHSNRFKNERETGCCTSLTSVTARKQGGLGATSPIWMVDITPATGDVVVSAPASSSQEEPTTRLLTSNCSMIQSPELAGDLQPVARDQRPLSLRVLMDSSVTEGGKPFASSAFAACAGTPQTLEQCTVLPKLHAALPLFLTRRSENLFLDVTTSISIQCLTMGKQDQHVTCTSIVDGTQCIFPGTSCAIAALDIIESSAAADGLTDVCATRLVDSKLSKDPNSLTRGDLVKALPLYSSSWRILHSLKSRQYARQAGHAATRPSAPLEMVAFHAGGHLPTTLNMLAPGGTGDGKCYESTRLLVEILQAGKSIERMQISWSLGSQQSSSTEKDGRTAMAAAMRCFSAEVQPHLSLLVKDNNLDCYGEEEKRKLVDLNGDSIELLPSGTHCQMLGGGAVCIQQLSATGPPRGGDRLGFTNPLSTLRKWLITGGAGALGSLVTGMLCRQGCKDLVLPVRSGRIGPGGGVSFKELKSSAPRLTLVM